MAVIGKIRSYSGLLIAVIGIALAAFVLGDLFMYGPTGGNSTEVGTVGKNKISYPEFESKVQQRAENWKQQTGNPNISQRDMTQIRQQVWTETLREILFSKEFERLGLAVSADELLDLIIGPNPHQAILQSFSNPADGSYDPEVVIEFIQNLDMVELSTQNQWFMLEDFIRQQRIEEKYHNMIRKGVYTPELLASLDHKNKNTSVDLRILAKRFSDIPDSLANVTDGDLRNTYNKHKHQFKQEAARNIEFVVFPVLPSEQDRNNIRAEVEALKPELETTQAIEPFVNSVSDRRFDPTYYGVGQLSPELESVMLDAEIGFIYGPYLENNAFVVSKLNDIQFRPDSMKAEHILIGFMGSQSSSPDTNLSREQAEAKADSLLQVVKANPNGFSTLAETLSDDPSAVGNKGDLGWFQDGAMVKPFNDAVINTPINQFTVAESVFGFHVIRVTGKSATSKKVQLATVTRNIEYSNQTYQRTFGEASAFASQLKDNNDFDGIIEEKGLSKRIAENLKPLDNSVPGIDNARPIVQWAFANRTDKNSISQIFDLEGRFVIARLTKIKEEGIPELSEIENEIRELAINEKKFELITQEFKAAGSSLDEIANSINLEVRVVNSLKFNTNTLTGFGNEPAVIGAAFGLKPNTLSSAIKGNTGVFMLEVINRDDADVPEDLTAQRNQIKTALRNRVVNETFRALEKSADVQDNRHNFY